MSTQPQSYGIKIARAGFDVNTCADYEMLFNSAWPSIAIAGTDTSTFTSSGSGEISGTLTHNLGFPPLTMSWVILNNATETRIFSSVDDNKAYIDYFALNDNTEYTIYTVFYNIDISQSAEYRYLPPSAVALPYDPSYGIKVVKQFKSINSTDLRDYILHSRAQSPAILSIQAQDSDSTGKITYTMNAGYTTWIYGYGFINNVWVTALLYNQSVPGLFVDNTNTFRVQLTPGQKGSLIVLRDPLFAATTVEVTY